MSTKLFLTVFVLPMAMGFVNVGQAMEDNIHHNAKDLINDIYKKTGVSDVQYLDEEKIALDMKFNDFFNFKDNNIVNIVKEVMHWMANNDDIMYIICHDRLFNYFNYKLSNFFHLYTKTK